MEIMDAVTKRSNLISCENQKLDHWNISYTRNNSTLSKRKLARFVASLICQTHEIENKLKVIAEQKYISVKEEESLKICCQLYDQMLVLIKEWKNLHFQNFSDREFRNANPWSQKIFESPDQNGKLVI